MYRYGTPYLRTLCAALVILAVSLPSALGLAVCTQIQQAVSSASAVYYPIDLLGNYAQDIAHWASSSSQVSACTVEPGTAADVSIVIKLLGTSRTPFAVKGGGPGLFFHDGRAHLFSNVDYDTAGWGWFDLGRCNAKRRRVSRHQKQKA